MMNPYQQALQAATAEFSDLEILIRRPTLDPSQWVAPALAALAEAKSFRSAEGRLRSLLRLAPVLSSGDLAIAAGSIRENNQIYQASDTPELLSNMYRETVSVPGAAAVWLDLGPVTKVTDVVFGVSPCVR